MERAIQSIRYSELLFVIVLSLFITLRSQNKRPLKLRSKFSEIIERSKIFVTNVSVKVNPKDRDGMSTKQGPTFLEGHESKQMLLYITCKLPFYECYVWREP